MYSSAIDYAGENGLLDTITIFRAVEQGKTTRYNRAAAGSGKRNGTMGAQKP
jgi:hypothetical protein